MNCAERWFRLAYQLCDNAFTKATRRLAMQNFLIAIAFVCTTASGSEVQKLGEEQSRLSKANEIARIQSEYPKRKFLEDHRSWSPNADQMTALVLESFDRLGWQSSEERKLMLEMVRQDMLEVRRTVDSAMPDQIDSTVAKQYMLHFDDEELDALLRFYRTDTGRLYLELKELIRDSIRNRRSKLGLLDEKRSVEPQALARRRAVIRTIIPLNGFSPETEVPPSVAEMFEKTELDYADVVGDVLDVAANRLGSDDHDLIRQFHVSVAGKKETNLSETVFAAVDKAIRAGLDRLTEPYKEKWRNAYRKLTLREK